jgi:hypothetical protein
MPSRQPPDTSLDSRQVSNNILTELRQNIVKKYQAFNKTTLLIAMKNLAEKSRKIPIGFISSELAYPRPPGRSILRPG